MKKVILVVAIFVLVISNLSAAKPVVGGANQTNMKRVDSISILTVEKISKDLTLTEDQKAKLLSSARQFYQKMEEVKSEGNKPSAHQTRKEASEAFQKTVENTLTAAQRNKMEERRAERRAEIEAKIKSSNGK